MGLCKFKIWEVFDESLVCFLFYLINIAPELFSPFVTFDSADGTFSRGMASLSIKEDIGRLAPLSFCYLPVDGRPTKMKYRLNGVLCCLYDIKLLVFTTNAVKVKMQGTR